MAMVAMLLSGVAGMSAFLVALLLGHPLLHAAQMYLAAGCATLALLCVWRFLARPCENIQDGSVRVPYRPD